MKTKIKCENRLWVQSKMFPLLKLAMLLLLGGTATQTLGAPGDVDLSFDPGSTINGQIHAVAFQSDGKPLIGGNFNTLQGAMRGGVARLNTNGSTDETFLHGLQGINDFGYVECLAIQSDDKVLIGGGFHSVNGVARTNIARLNADGSLDGSFLVQLGGDYGNIENLAVLSNGQIFVVGRFDSLSGVPRTNIARLNMDGSVDSSFYAELVAEGAPGEAYLMAVQHDGKIVVGGWFTAVNGTACTNLARLNANGTLDTTFTPDLAVEDGPGFPSCLALQSDGKILVGGAFSSVSGVWRTNIARLNVDGSLDDSFACTNAEPSGDVYRIIPCRDGKMIACGSFTPDGVQWMNVARLNVDGTLDTSFRNAFPEGGVTSAAIQNDDKIVVVGEFWKADGAVRRCVARLNSDGSLDNAFNNSASPTGPNWGADSVLVQGDGKVLIGGRFYSVNGQTHEGIARLHPDGSLDGSFTASIGGSYPYLQCMALQPDGKILLGGEFGMVNGVTRNGIARLNPDGTLDNTFMDGLAGADRGVRSISIQTNGQIIVGGLFATVNGEPRNRLARLNADGTLDPVVFSYFNNDLHAVSVTLVQRDGKILVGRDLPLWLLRFNDNGTWDSSFGCTATEIYCLAQQPDGKILAGGHLIKGEVHRNGVARILPDGTEDDSFLNGLIGPEGPVYRLALEADGKIIVAGDFRSVDGVARKHIARLNAEGSLDVSFNIDLHAWDNPVSAIAVQPDTKILLGGYFTAVNQTPRSYVARLMGSCVPPSIRNMPQHGTVEIGSSAWLSVVADGFPAVAYQWFFNGTNALAGCTNHSLQLSDVQSAHVGSYTVVISNAGGAVTSGPALLNVIAAVGRRLVPGINVLGDAGSLLNVDYVNSLRPVPDWLPLAVVSLTSTSQYCFDLTAPLPPQRFYRTWQKGTPAVVPSLDLNFVPALTLTGDIGSAVRVDGIKQFGPTDAWFTLDTVTLTNTSQLYFDVTAPGQPQRLYRLVPVP